MNCLEERILKDGVVKKAEKLEKIGYKEYLANK